MQHILEECEENGYIIEEEKIPGNDWRKDVGNSQLNFDYLDFLDSALHHYPEKLSYKDYNRANQGDSKVTIEARAATMKRNEEK